MIDSDEPRKPIMSKSTYDIISMIAQYWLPAAGTLYFTLSQIWGLPYAEQVVGTILAVSLFLGVLLGYAKFYYNRSDERYDGELVIDTHDPMKDTYSLNVSTPILELENKDEISLKVQH